MSRMTPVPTPVARDVKYVLVTPARNEERFIRATIEAVCAQTIRPLRWIIVDDGSTDRTGDIADEYALRETWIEVIRRPQRQQRSFAGKAHAFNAGFERLRGLDFDFVGSLDADVTFAPDYFEHLLNKFQASAHLGLVGTGMIEEGYDPLKESFFNEQDVFGACQLFRRTCFDAVGGYTPVRGGGIDWIAVRTARMKGWQTRCFLDKSFYHHRPMGATESNVLRARFEYGQKDYYLGNHPLWEVFRIGFQLTARPYVIGGLLIMAGYLYGVFTRMERPLSAELLAFHRHEQLGRLRGLIAKRLFARAASTRSLGRPAER
jgi:poly-beta-1,6-N-acetyl-D-glucosamine synthase